MTAFHGKLKWETRNDEKEAWEPLFLPANGRGWLDFRIAALQYCSMAIAVPISKRGTFTIPPEIRKRLGVDQLENPMLLVEERDGKIYLEPAAAIPVRDIPKATLRSWIKDDEAAMSAFKKSKKRS